MLYVTNLVDHGGLDVACFEIDIVISASKVFCWSFCSWSFHKSLQIFTLKYPDRSEIYPLVNVYITMENHHFQWENPLFLWPF